MFRIFNRFARTPKSDFERNLTAQFDKETAKQVKSVLTDLGLPLPDKKDTFMDATQGALLFLDRYGIVIRIEKKSSEAIEGYNMRFNNNALVLQPLASIHAGKAIVEICPGCLPSTDIQPTNFLRQELKKDNISYYDYKLANTGLLPFKTSVFPDGIPVVIDRLAVTKLNNAYIPLKSLLSKINPQKFLYAPLIQTFEEAWPQGQPHPHPEKMQGFWKLCEENVTTGVLVAGWKQPVKPSKFEDKKDKAIIIGQAYAKKLNPT